MLHFVLLGAALFAVHALTTEGEGKQQIVVTDRAIEALRQRHLRQTREEPTPEQERRLIEAYIDEEVLYREALALGLDQTDPVVRRRLVQSMTFLVEGTAPPPEPSEADLRAYLAQHADRYRRAPRVALRHVFVSRDRHGDDTEREATRLLEALTQGVEPGDLGDPFLRGHRFPLKSEEELTNIFGADFAARAMDLPTGVWQGPLRSAYGSHLVLVEAVSEGTEPELATIREAVLRDWRVEWQRQADLQAIRRLRGDYDIKIGGE